MTEFTSSMSVPIPSQTAKFSTQLSVSKLQEKKQQVTSKTKEEIMFNVLIFHLCQVTQRNNAAKKQQKQTVLLFQYSFKSGKVCKFRTKKVCYKQRGMLDEFISLATSLKGLSQRCLNQKANKISCLLKFIAEAYQQGGKNTWKKKEILRLKDQHSQSINILFLVQRGAQSCFSFEN